MTTSGIIGGILAVVVTIVFLTIIGRSKGTERSKRFAIVYGLATKADCRRSKWLAEN